MRGTVPAGILATLALLPAAAGAASTDRADVDLRLTAQAPGSPTGMEIDLRYKHPDDPEAKPPPIARVEIALPEGTRLDTAATPRCEATDEELRLLGRAACPPGSEVGHGTLTAITGLGAPVDPVRGDVTVFNGGEQLIELVTFAGTELTAGIDRLHIDGTVLTAHPPATPGGPPDGQTAIRDIRLDFPSGPLLTTPPVCPPSGAWTSRGTFSFADGGTTSLTSPTPCAPAAEPQLQLRRRCAAQGGLRMELRGDVSAVRDVNFKLDRRLVHRDTRPPFAGRLDTGTLGRTRARRLRAVAYLHRGGRAILARSLPRCGP